MTVKIVEYNPNTPFPSKMMVFADSTDGFAPFLAGMSMIGKDDVSKPDLRIFYSGTDGQTENTIPEPMPIEWMGYYVESREGDTILLLRVAGGDVSWDNVFTSITAFMDSNLSSDLETVVVCSSIISSTFADTLGEGEICMYDWVDDERIGMFMTSEGFAVDGVAGIHDIGWMIPHILNNIYGFNQEQGDEKQLFSMLYAPSQTKDVDVDAAKKMCEFYNQSWDLDTDIEMVDEVVLALLQQIRPAESDEFMGNVFDWGESH